MARHLWAKIRVDLRHHPRLIGRPDADFRLWTSLLLHAKEHCPDGVVRGMGAADMRGAWGIKAPNDKVRHALSYFVREGMLVEQSDGYLIADFIEEQKTTKDNPDAVWARQKEKRARDKEAGVTGVVTGVVTGGVTGNVTAPDTRDKRHVTAIEEEKEEEKEEEADLDPAAAAWDQELLIRLRAAFRVTELTSSDFRDFLASSLAYPKQQREAAAEAFLARGCVGAGKRLGYLVSMIRGRATQPARNGFGKPATGDPEAHLKATQARAAEDRAAKAQALKEFADAKARGEPSPFEKAKAKVAAEQRQNGGQKP